MRDFREDMTVIVAKKDAHQHTGRYAKGSVMGAIWSKVEQSMSRITINQSPYGSIKMRNPSSDSAAIMQDWKAVGDDLRSVYLSYLQVKKTTNK